jgi:hypothetical protein
MDAYPSGTCHQQASILGRLAVLAVLVMSTATAALSQETCCNHCGAMAHVRSVCRPIVTTRSVEVTCWDVVEESIAVPSRYSFSSATCGLHFGACCATGTCARCASGACPRCCKVRPRNRLMRKTFLDEEPVVVWTVEYLCESCMQQWSMADRGGGPERPASPAAASILDGLIRTARGLAPGR